MQATSFTPTYQITSSQNAFRVWWNDSGYWQTDILSDDTCWLYFGCASTLQQAFANVAITF